LFENVDVFYILKILYFFVFFELLENTCHTTRAVGQTLKGKENYFWYFENECHAVRATGQTQKSERGYFSFFRFFFYFFYSFCNF